MRKFRAFFGLRSLLATQAIKPPIIEKKNGNRYNASETSYTNGACSTPHFTQIFALISIPLRHNSSKILVFFQSLNSPKTQ